MAKTIDERMDEKMTVVSKLYGDMDSLEDDEIDLTEQFPLIPLKFIKPRKTNRFSKLAGKKFEDFVKSIETNGIIEMPIVFPDKESDKPSYYISAGHNRIRAWKTLYERAKEENDIEKIKKYSKVRCRVLTDKEMEFEEQIHKDSNEKRRSDSIFEIILRYAPYKDMFLDENNRNAYLIRKFGNDAIQKYENGLIRVKFNLADIKEFIALKFQDDYSDLEVSNATIARYTQAVINSSEKVKDAVLDSKIPQRYVVSTISSLDFDDQDKIVDLVYSGTDIIEAIDSVIKESNIIKEVTDTPSELSPADLLIKTGKHLYKLISDKDNYFNQIKNINKKEFNGNQKEYLKQINKVFKEIEKLSNMPEK